MLRRAALMLLGVLAFGLAAELLLRALPVSTATQMGYHLDPQIRSYPSGHHWTAATGWDLRNHQRLQANNMGFLSERPFVPDPTAVALVGDSYVEASMLPAHERLAALLQRRLPQSRAVYAMGGPGTSLLDYAERVRWASQTLGVRDFVLLVEAADVVQSLCGSGNSDGPCLDRVTLAPRFEPHAQAGPLKEALRHSALAQYVFSQLKFNPARLWRQAVAQAQPAQGHDVGKPKAATAASPAAADLRMVQAVTERFLARSQPHASGKLIVLLDADRLGLGRARAEREHFKLLLRQAGVRVIDAEPLFAAHAAQTKRSLEVGPYDRHLNVLGLSLLAEPAAAALLGGPP
jgi:hypothetical protein